jgi:hypothetical protein
VSLYAEDELALDHFAVYRIPIPDAFQAGNGERCIRAAREKGTVQCATVTFSAA